MGLLHALNFVIESRKFLPPCFSFASQLAKLCLRGFGKVESNFIRHSPFVVDDHEKMI